MGCELRLATLIEPLELPTEPGLSRIEGSPVPPCRRHRSVPYVSRATGGGLGLEERPEHQAHDARQERGPLLGGERCEGIHDAVRSPEDELLERRVTGPACA